MDVICTLCMQFMAFITLVYVFRFKGHCTCRLFGHVCWLKCQSVHFHVDRWTRPDIAPESGMANVIVGIPTGYVISRDTVEWMYRANYTGLHRILFYKQKLITFFSHVSAHTCHCRIFCLSRLFVTFIQKWSCLKPVLIMMMM